MKESVMQQKKKLMTNTYMREVTKHQTIVIKESDDYFVTLKRFDSISKPFVLGDVPYIGNGSYMVEITPLNENYNIRKYVSKDKKEVGMYIDVTLKNGEQDNVPYYIDLYLDIVKGQKESLRFLDEDELEDALNDGSISKEDFELAHKVGDQLMNELQEQSNKYVNMDVTKIVNKYFE